MVIFPSQNVAARNDVSAMPTFHFYKNGNKVSDLVGASKEKLKGKVEELAH